MSNFLKNFSSISSSIVHYTSVSASSVLSLFVMVTPLQASTLSTQVSDAPIELVVAGSIAARCELGQGGEMDLGELGPGISVAARFGLACNLPFDLFIKSDNGGLAHTTKPAGEGPYVGNLGYSVSIDLPLLSTTARSQLTGSFTSSALRVGSSLSSGALIADGGGTLRVTTQIPGGAGLLAGNYTDRVVVTLNTRL